MPAIRWVVGEQVYKISLVPSGIVTGTLSIIGNGVVLDPWALKAEIEKLEGQGVHVDRSNFAVADNCPLILPFHRDLDALRETAAGKGKIGTTGRGIGPAYEDKVGRRAIRVCDLAHLDDLDAQLDRLCAHHDALRAGFGQGPVDRAALVEELREIAPFVLQFAEPVWKRLRDVRKAGKRILFEGAQGVLLDVDHGTYPFVTSSNTVSGTVASGTGMGPNAAGFVLGYRQGLHDPRRLGPFPDRELTDETGERLGQRGHEFGTVTARKRRCGWFDAVLVRQTCALSGVTGIALTKIDVLDGFETIRICTGYKLNGKLIDYLPAHAAEARKPSSRSMREMGRLERHDRRRAQLGAASRAGDQIYPPHRGTDRMPGSPPSPPARSATIPFSCAIPSRTECCRFAAAQERPPHCPFPAEAVRRAGHEPADHLRPFPRGASSMRRCRCCGARGIEPEAEFYEKSSRALKFATTCPASAIIRVRAFDVATFVAHGAAQIGIVGSDVIAEFGYSELYAPVDLAIGHCRLSVAEPEGRPARGTVPRRAMSASPPNIPISPVPTTRRRGIQAECVKLNGAMELAPSLGLSRRIVDLVSSGRDAQGQWPGRDRHDHGDFGAPHRQPRRDEDACRRAGADGRALPAPAVAGGADAA